MDNNTWIHLPTPGDHYSPSTGSAIMSVVYELTRCHEQAGFDSTILVSEGTYDNHYLVGRVQTTARHTKPGKTKKAIDFLLARMGLPRHFSAHYYAPSVEQIPANFKGTVFVHNGQQALQRIRRRAPKCRLYLYAHNDLLRTYSQREAERLLGHTDGVICVSDYIRRITASEAPAMADKLHVVLNGVNTETFKPPATPPANTEPVVMFVGRMIEEKGARILIEAAKHALLENIPFKLKIVGSQGFTDQSPLSHYEQELRRQAQPLGEKIEFLPFVPRDKIVDLYQSADIFCVPSVWEEPLGLTVSEAMACGLPVIASRRGGIPEQGGIAVEYFDPDHPVQLADQLYKLLTNPTKRRQQGEACREQALRLSWINQYEKLSEVCSE